MLKLYFQPGGWGLDPPETERKLGMKPRMRFGCSRSRGMGLPSASTGMSEAGLGCLSPWLAFCAGWPVCARSAEMAKPNGPVRSDEEEDSPESATEALAARRLADGCGASGSCTCWAPAVEARPKQTRARIKRKHTVLKALGITAPQKPRFRGLS